MSKVSYLQYISNYYSLVCEASLRSDMAKRIMYSVLPSVATETEIYGTGGVVDYKALQAAVEGRHDLIKYGTRACVQELRHYKDKNLYPLTKELVSAGNYSEAMTLAVKAFSDYSGWSSDQAKEKYARYGGKAWEKIARSIKKLIDYDQALKKIRETNPKDHDKELQIMQQIVVEMNVLDGLSHNNSTIMRNLVEQEWLEFHPNEKDPAAREAELDAITRMMDAKELSNPIDVYQEIEKTLEGSGDLARYKDWTRKLRQQPSYNKGEEQKIENLFKIRIHKSLLPYISRLNDNGDYLKSTTQTLEQSISNIDSGSKLPSNIYKDLTINIVSIRGTVAQALLVLQTLKNKLPPKHGMLDLINSIISNIEKLKTHLANDVSSFEKAWSSSAEASKLTPDRKVQLLKTLANLIQRTKSITFFLDSI